MNQSSYNRNPKQTRAMKRKLAGYQNWRCAYCGALMEYKDTTIDHVISLRKGGSQKEENLVVSCYACNMSKGSLDAKIFFSIRQKGLEDGSWPRGLRLHPTVVRLMSN